MELHSNSNGSLSSQSLCVGADGPPCPRTPKIFALIIGINKYSNESGYFPPLKGAVTDADSVSEFLIKHRGADPNQVKNLRDEQATQSEIVDSINDFANNTMIQKEDAIVIFFAGHTRGPNKGSFDEEDPVSLWAVDSSLDDPESGLTGEAIYNLLFAISRSKGSNIVLVLDTCHSSYFAPQDIRNIRSIQSATGSEDFKEPYVLVSACRFGESTTDHLFTQIMLHVLKNNEPATYSDLLNLIRAEYRNRSLRIHPGYYGYNESPHGLLGVQHALANPGV